VLTPFGSTKEVDLKWGVRQGEVLSPLKFIAWLNPWLEYAFKIFPNSGISWRMAPYAFMLMPTTWGL
jgi:hypothetical protein